MNKLARPLTKILLITVLLFISIILMTFIGFGLIFGLIFFYLAGKIWNYKPKISQEIESVEHEEITDYYEFFHISEDAKTEGIEIAYQNEMTKLEENISFSLETKNEIESLLKEGYFILVNEESRTNYNKLLSKQKVDAALNSENTKLRKIQDEKFYFTKEVLSMLKFK